MKNEMIDILRITNGIVAIIMMIAFLFTDKTSYGILATINITLLALQ